MPLVRIELFPGRTPEQKAECARAIIDAVSRHLNVPPEATQVMFFDVERNDWLVGGKLPPPKQK